VWREANERDQAWDAVIARLRVRLSTGMKQRRVALTVETATDGEYHLRAPNPYLAKGQRHG
jgi:hypothetical protein